MGLPFGALCSFAPLKLTVWFSLFHLFYFVVYDVKPYVHWDIPNEVKVLENRIGGIGLKLPHWVETKDDVLPGVVFAPEAEECLRYFVRNNKLSPFLYPSKDSMSFVAAKQTLIEILSQDPRSSHRGLSKNQRGSISGTPKGSEEDVYRLSFGKVLIEFIVTSKGAIVKNILEGPPASALPPSSPSEQSAIDADTSRDDSTAYYSLA